MPGGIHPPREVLLSWPAPNYVNPQRRTPSVLITACILGPLTVSITFARLRMRFKVQRNAGWDDWLMLTAIGPTITLTVIFTLVTVHYRFDRHIWDVEPHYFIVQRKLVLAIEVIFIFTAGLIKISILLFYRRLSSRSISPIFRWTTWISIAFIASYSIAFTLIPIFGCRPISAFWDQSDITKTFEGYSYHCFNEGADVFAAGIISAFQDLITTILPNFLFWSLQIPLRQKIVLFCIFAIGYSVVAIAALRVYFSWVIYFETYDVTWTAWNNILFTMLELHIGTICANAPALKTLFKHFLRLERFTSRSRSRSKSHSHGSDARREDSHALFWTRGYAFLLNFGMIQHKHNPSTKKHQSQFGTDVSVDMYGGARKDKKTRKHPTITTSSVNVIGDNFENDIEMGTWYAAAVNSDTSEENLSALPPILRYPQTPRTAVTRQTGAWKN